MTAQPHNPPALHTPGPPEATPRAVRAALLPEDVAQFDREFRAVMAEAADTFDLAAVNACVQRWRLVAWSSADPAAERAMRKQSARLAAGEDIPTVPWEQVKARLGI
jgi:aspartate aminotransferase-like enzyme